MRVEVEDLTVEYDGVKALEGVNLRLEGPGLVQVIGPNGAGKTSLLRAMLGLVKPSRGRVLIDGVDVTGSPRLAGRFAGYVPQRPRAPRLSPMTVLELVVTGLRMRGRRNPRGLAVE
ncbi:MAG: ATP-binding cassette domain-containing protein, partial [Desulfurococcales archaeon]|nr:ATP-binding cassette domain-containing protein [Desulfurococcales archaeon]